MKTAARIVAAGLLPAVFFVWVGFRGLDFGFHWDEENLVKRVRHAAETGILLPGTYNYPSVWFWLAFGGLLPEAVGGQRMDSALAASALTRTPASETLVSATQGEPFRLRVRGIFLAVTALTMFATAGLALAAGAALAEAALASAVVATSWEFTYHARWIAPDGVMAMFVTAALAFAAADTYRTGTLTALSRRAGPQAGPGWLLGAAAVSTGLALGTKYTAWPLLVVLALAAVMAHGNREGRSRTKAGAQSLAIALLVFAVTTPGMFLQPGPFLRSVIFEVGHYATGHGRHTVPAGPVHLWQMLVYAGAVLTSPFRAAALWWTALAVVGTWTLARRSRRLAGVLLTFPVLYVLWFSTQKVMIARNLLVLAPIVAVLAARGAAMLWHALQGRPSIRLVAVLGACGVALAAGVGFGLRSAESIAGRHQLRAVTAFAEWIAAHPGRPLAVSRRLEADLAGTGTRIGSVDGPAWAAFYADEQGELPSLPSNRLGLVDTVIGPSDANFDYYTDWVGSDHILILEPDAVARLGFRVR